MQSQFIQLIHFSFPWYLSLKGIYEYTRVEKKYDVSGFLCKTGQRFQVLELYLSITRENVYSMGTIAWRIVFLWG